MSARILTRIFVILIGFGSLLNSYTNSHSLRNNLSSFGNHDYELKRDGSWVEEATNLRKQLDMTNDVCPNCLNNNVKELSENELKQLRFDLIKSQILQKLHLKKAPSPASPMPFLNPILTAIENMDDTAYVSETENEEFYSKTESVVIFPNNSDYLCNETNISPCSRFEFLLPKELEDSVFTAIQLWVYKYNDSFSLPLTIWQPASPVDENTNTASILASDVPLVAESYVWVKLTLPTTINFTSFGNNQIFVVEASGSAVVESGNEKPFLIIHTSNKVAPRKRRSVDCVEGGVGCCRKSLYISFAEMGWDNWVVHPPGYFANFCLGKCLMADLSLPLYHHSSVLYTYFRYNHTMAESMGLTMCCTPSQLSPIKMLYMDTEGNIHEESIPNMIVDSCECA